MQRWILHVDMDAFYASVEERDHPELKGKPVIIGGASRRGVVSTCSYEARKFGVHSAMPLFQAKRLCPNGIYIKGNMHHYAQVSGQIMEIFRETSPLVEQLSIDEAFLDLTGMEGLGGAEKIARQVQDRIWRELRLSASVGLAPNKFLAKLASDLRKPHGFVKITPEEAEGMLAPMPVTKIFGIGEKARQRLEEFGICTIGQLVRTDLSVLQQVFGINAAMIRDLGRGLDSRPVINDEEAKSIGKEMTFSRDYTEFEDCRDALLDLAGQVGWRLRRENLAGRTVTVKVKYADFTTRTRSRTGDGLFRWDEEIFAMAEKVLEQINLKQGIRLLGITVSGLEPAGQEPSLGFDEEVRLQKRNTAVDALKSRFGESIIQRGILRQTKDPARKS